MDGILATTLGDVVLTAAATAENTGSNADQCASLHAGGTGALGGCHEDHRDGR